METVGRYNMQDWIFHCLLSLTFSCNTAILLFFFTPQSNWIQQCKRHHAH
uniref:Uncharacterized protein n=1 Tax=Rhizophora mucronata TaxID=61149 RepID=A0A2P2NTR5_RHIMU